MVNLEITYKGELSCSLLHEPSSSTITTDAPVDNQGKGRTFSPTDLMAASLGSCIATIMGITAQARGWDLQGMRITVAKEMATQGPRRIASLETHIHMPLNLTGADRKVAEKVPDSCPVKMSLHPDIKVPITFHWPE